MVNPDPSRWPYRVHLRRVSVPSTLDMERLRESALAEVRPLTCADAPDSAHLYGDWETSDRVLLAPTGGGQLTGVGNARLEVTFSDAAARGIELRMACSPVIVIGYVIALIVFAGFVALATGVESAPFLIVIFPLLGPALGNIHFIRLVRRTSRTLDDLIARVSDEKR